VNGARAWHKKGALNNLLAENPDIFCLQETKAHPDQLPDDLRFVKGFQSFFDHSKIKKGYSGVAIYTKIPPEKIEYQIDDQENSDLDQEGRTLILHFEKFILVNCYFPNGGSGEERLAFKLRFYDAFLKKILALQKSGKAVIFCGDVNTAHTEIDLARPKENERISGFLPVERKWLDEVVANNFVDSFRFLHPDEVKYSWWDMKTFARERNIGWRIDYFFISQKLVSKISGAEIEDKIFGSDHCPVVLKIDL
jgi:exodeoxyribonuclease-3